MKETLRIGPDPKQIPAIPRSDTLRLGEALPQRITMKKFKPTNERCAVIFASPRLASPRIVGGAAWATTSFVGGAFMKFNKLILNYVPNCQTSQPTDRATSRARMPLEFYANSKGSRWLNELLRSRQARQLGPYVFFAAEVENKTVNLFRHRLWLWLRPNWPIGAA